MFLKVLSKLTAIIIIIIISFSLFLQQGQFILTHHHPVWNQRPNGWSKQAFVIVVQLPSHVQFFASPWTAACQASLSLTISWSLPKFMSIESMVPSSHLILWHLLLLLPSTFPSMREFSSELTVHIRWSKYWSFSFSISPSSRYSGFISLKIDWLDLLAVQGTFRNLL